MTTNAKKVEGSEKQLDFFERYLSVWVLVCMGAGIALGKLFPDLTGRVSRWQFGQGSQVNVAIAVLIWLMIYPMMLKIDFGGLKGVEPCPACGKEMAFRPSGATNGFSGSTPGWGWP